MYREKKEKNDKARKSDHLLWFMWMAFSGMWDMLLLFRDTVLFFLLSDSGQGYMLEAGIVEPDGSQPKRIKFPKPP